MNGVSPGGTCRNYRKRHKEAASPLVDKAGIRRERIARTAKNKKKKKKKRDCRIPLSRRLFALVDPEDFEELSQYKWFASGRGRHMYAVRHEKGRTISMHRQIMKAPRNRQVDHKDCDSLNNHRDNLCFATLRQNRANISSRRGSSRFAGVYRHKDKRLAQIMYRGRNCHLGLFEDEVEAAKARDRKAWELHGEFAYLNFPEDYGR
jgi:hypothetical protein